jgi:hypothetical protein
VGLGEGGHSLEEWVYEDEGKSDEDEIHVSRAINAGARYIYSST